MICKRLHTDAIRQIDVMSRIKLLGDDNYQDGNKSLLIFRRAVPSATKVIQQVGL
jgi:hypothetical protein